MNIDQLAKMSDDELAAKLGLTAKLEDAKAAIASLEGLEGDERTYAEKRVKDMFEPHVWAEDLKYIAEDAKCVSAKEEAADCSCKCL